MLTTIKTIYLINYKIIQGKYLINFLYTHVIALMVVTMCVTDRSDLSKIFLELFVNTS